MTYKEVATIIESIDLPFAYYQFPENTELAPPFICFFFTADDDFIADDKNYVGVSRLVIELYTDEKDFTLEGEVEQMLRNNNIVYIKTETYIDSERMWMIVYESEVILNG